MSSPILKTVKLPLPLARALSRLAKERECSESELIREGIEIVTRGDSGLDMTALIGTDIGAFRGPSDLSNGKAHREGYGRSRHR